MKAVLSFEEANRILKPFYAIIKDCLTDSFGDTLKVKDMFVENGVFVTLKPRTKGSIINDSLKTRLETSFQNQQDIKILEAKNVVGILFYDKIFIRFNKMDAKFSTAIQKTKSFYKYYNQAQEIEGLPPRVTIVWGGFIPLDKMWSAIARYFLVCFDGGLNWYYDMEKDAVEQLSIEIGKTTKRRVRPKKGNDDEEQKTGTNS